MKYLLTLLFACTCLGGELESIPPLKKVHYSWPYNNAMLENPDAELKEVVRISRAIGITIWSSEKAIRNAGQIASDLKIEVAVNFSPWGNIPSTQPSQSDPELYAEIAKIGQRLKVVKSWLGETAKIGIVLIDDEKWEDDPLMIPWRDRLYNISKFVFQDAPVIFYQSGSVTACASQSGWCGSPIKEGDYPNCQLYAVPHPYQMREHVKRTVAANSGRDIAVWVALGCGYHPMLSTMGMHSWNPDWKYDTVYSFNLGREICNPWYGAPAQVERFANWNKVKFVIFYPSYKGSPDWVKHFTAYAQGANK